MRRHNCNLKDGSGKQRHSGAAGATVQRLGSPQGVLVVNDDHLMRIMMQLGLERNGFEVILAANGREAIDRYRLHRGKIDVVLLDARMQGLDGMETMDALRKLAPQLPACFLTGDTDDEDTGELLRRGAAHVVAKPFLLDELANTLHSLADGAGHANGYTLEPMLIS